MEQNDEMLLKEAQDYFDSRKYADAYNIYSKLAERNDITALSRCGFMYKNGLGTKKNLSEAYRSLEKAIQLGSEESKEEFSDLCNRAPFNADGSIDITKKKRSTWATVFIVLFLLSSFTNMFMLFTPAEDEAGKSLMLSMGIGGIIMFVCTLSLLLWKKLGGYILLGLIVASCIAYLLMFALPSSMMTALIGFASNGMMALLLFLLLQIKKNGVPAWNVLMRRPYVGRNVMTEMKDNVTAYGRGEQFSASSPETIKLATWGKIATILIALGAIACAVLIIIAGRFDFHINWNFFSSVLAFPLFIIGLFISIFWLSGMEVRHGVEWKDPVSGKKRRAESTDVVDVMGGQILMPLLTKFVIYPIVIAMGAYYILMCLFYLLEAIFPYVMAVLLIASIVLFRFYMGKTLDKLYRKALIPTITLIFFFAYFLIYMIWNSNTKAGNLEIVQEEVTTETVAPATGSNEQEASVTSPDIDFGTRYIFEGTLSDGKAVILTLDGSGGSDFNLSGTFCYKDDAENAIDLMGNADSGNINASSDDTTIKGVYDGKTFKGTISKGGNSQTVDIKLTKSESLLD